MTAKRFAHVTDRQLRAWVVRGYPASRIASLIGCSTEDVDRRIESLWQKTEAQSHEPAPTPEEIAERAAIERSRWSEEEEQRRRVGCSRASVEATVVPESYLQRLRPGGR